jgi:enoyl-CoA hydratase/carnithine racemase
MKAARVQVPAVINAESVRAFAQEIERDCLNESHRVILLSGRRGTFCRGMDLAALSELPAGTDLMAELEAFAACLRQIRYAAKPVVAVVDGEALAGGVGVVAACDFVIATAGSTFGLSELLFGLVPAIALPLLLERMPALGVRRWALTGRAHSAAEAQGVGLVDVVVEPQRLERAINHWVRQLSRANSAAVAKLKSLSAEAPGLGFEAALRRGVSVTAETLRDESVVGGIRGFLAGESAPWEAA